MRSRIGAFKQALFGNNCYALNAWCRTVFSGKTDKANEYPIKQTFTQKANDIPTKQTITFQEIRCDRRKQEKPASEMTPGRAALCLERLKTPWNQGGLGKKEQQIFLSISAVYFGCGWGIWTHDLRIMSSKGCFFLFSSAMLGWKPLRGVAPMLHPCCSFP